RTRSFVKAALTPLPFLLVTTTKPDKYDRYLTDVFYQAGEDDPDAVLRTGTFLNRQLVSEGLAERFRD
ncbi:MAG: thermonuclease family protein, partial [bacterium]|nr:thermonuclease family protein [bacterium]